MLLVNWTIGICSSAFDFMQYRTSYKRGVIVYRSRPASIVKLLLVSIVLFLLVFPLMTGCDFIDQLIEQITGGGVPGGSTSNAPTAVMIATVALDDALVNAGLNPDLRPPLRYQFSAADSLNEEGVSVLDPYAGLHETSWDFGDGMGTHFSPSMSTIHLYRWEGPHTASLTLRGAGGATDTVYQTITLGPGWLEIVSLTWETRPDNKAVVTVIVRNQSRQALQRIGVNLHVDGSIWQINALNVAFGEETTPVRLSPGATYTLTKWVNQWTGTLTASSGECIPYPLE